jgi:hypothetical protein
MKEIKKRTAMQNCFLIIFTILLAFKAEAQEVVSTSGEFSVAGSGSLSWTIGEAITETFSSGNITLTQGFQQSNLTITAIDEVAGLSFSITAFPNPATDNIYLMIDNKSLKNIGYQLFDTSGKLIVSAKIDEKESSISLNKFPPAVYLLKVTESDKPIKTFKVIKK